MTIAIDLPWILISTRIPVFHVAIRLDGEVLVLIEISSEEPAVEQSLQIHGLARVFKQMRIRRNLQARRDDDAISREWILEEELHLVFFSRNDCSRISYQYPHRVLTWVDAVGKVGIARRSGSRREITLHGIETKRSARITDVDFQSKALEHGIPWRIPRVLVAESSKGLWIEFELEDDNVVFACYDALAGGPLMIVFAGSYRLVTWKNPALQTLQILPITQERMG